MTTTTATPATCPFTVGQEVVTKSGMERGIVTGWSFNRDGRCIVGVRCSYPSGDSYPAYYAECWQAVEPTPPAEPKREIVYNRFDKCYDLFLDGQIVGYAWNHDDGEKVLDQLVHDRLQPQPPTPAAQMRALAEQYTEAKATGRLLEAANLKAQAEAIEAAHPGTQLLVLESRKAAA